MKPIRIMHVMNDFSNSSISRIVEYITRILNNGYEWHVASFDGQGDMEVELKNLSVETIHFLPQQVQGQGRLRYIRNYLLERKINIVHTHTPRAIVELFFSMVGMSVRPCHLATKHLLTTPKDRRWGLLYSLLDALTLYMPDQLVTVSETMKEGVLALPGRWNGRVISVQNAIPCAKFYLPEDRLSSRLNLGFAPGQLVFGYAGRIEPVKLLNLLLESFTKVHKILPETRLLIIGEGSQRVELEQYTKDLGIEHAVIWMGFRPDIPSLLASMDIYVQPSHNEGLSLSILEAMAAGKPVIATNVGGAKELLCHRQTGLLIPAHSLTALAEAMLELSMQPNLRTQLAQAAQKYVSEQFSIERMVAAYDRIYQSLGSNSCLP